MGQTSVDASLDRPHVFFLQRSGESCQSSPASPWRGVTGGGSACCATTGALASSGGDIEVQVVVDNHTIDDSLWLGCDQKGSKWARAHECTKVHKPYKKTASNRHATPPDRRAAFLVAEETDMRIQYDPGPLLLIAGVTCRGACGGGTPGFGQMRRCTRVKLVPLNMNSYKIRANFVRIHVNSRL